MIISIKKCVTELNIKQNKKYNNMKKKSKKEGLI